MTQPPKVVGSPALEVSADFFEKHYNPIWQTILETPGVDVPARTLRSELQKLRKLVSGSLPPDAEELAQQCPELFVVPQKLNLQARPADVVQKAPRPLRKGLQPPPPQVKQPKKAKTISFEEFQMKQRMNVPLNAYAILAVGRFLRLVKRRRRHQLRRKLAGLVAPSGPIVTILRNKENLVPYHLQGNLRWYTDESLELRENIRKQTLARLAVERWWDHCERDPNDEMSEKMYQLLCQELLKVLMAGLPKADAQKIIHQDWLADSKGQRTLTKEMFFDAIFDLADVWCESDVLFEYVDFLDTCYEAVFPGNGGVMYVSSPEVRRKALVDAARRAARLEQARAEALAEKQADDAAVAHADLIDEIVGGLGPEGDSDDETVETVDTGRKAGGEERGKRMSVDTKMEPSGEPSSTPKVLKSALKSKVKVTAPEPAKEASFEEYGSASSFISDDAIAEALAAALAAIPEGEDSTPAHSEEKSASGETEDTAAAAEGKNSRSLSLGGEWDVMEPLPATTTATTTEPSPGAEGTSSRLGTASSSPGVTPPDGRTRDTPETPEPRGKQPSPLQEISDNSFSLTVGEGQKFAAGNSASSDVLQFFNSTHSPTNAAKAAAGNWSPTAASVLSQSSWSTFSPAKGKKLKKKKKEGEESGVKKYTTELPQAKTDFLAGSAGFPRWYMPHDLEDSVKFMKSAATEKFLGLEVRPPLKPPVQLRVKVAMGFIARLVCVYLRKKAQQLASGENGGVSDTGADVETWLEVQDARITALVQERCRQRAQRLVQERMQELEAIAQWRLQEWQTQQNWDGIEDQRETQAKAQLELFRTQSAMKIHEEVLAENRVVMLKDLAELRRQLRVAYKKTRNISLRLADPEEANSSGSEEEEKTVQVKGTSKSTLVADSSKKPQDDLFRSNSERELGRRFDLFSVVDEYSKKFRAADYPFLEELSPRPKKGRKAKAKADPSSEISVAVPPSTPPVAALQLKRLNIISAPKFFDVTRPFTLELEVQTYEGHCDVFVDSEVTTKLVTGSGTISGTVESKLQRGRLLMDLCYDSVEPISIAVDCPTLGIHSRTVELIPNPKHVINFSVAQVSELLTTLGLERFAEQFSGVSGQQLSAFSIEELGTRLNSDLAALELLLQKINDMNAIPDEEEMPREPSREHSSRVSTGETKGTPSAEDEDAPGSEREGSRVQTAESQGGVIPISDGISVVTPTPRRGRSRGAEEAPEGAYGYVPYGVEEDDDFGYVDSARLTYEQKRKRHWRQRKARPRHAAADNATLQTLEPSRRPSMLRSARSSSRTLSTGRSERSERSERSRKSSRSTERRSSRRISSVSRDDTDDYQQEEDEEEEYTEREYERTIPIPARATKDTKEGHSARVEKRLPDSGSRRPVESSKPSYPGQSSQKDSPGSVRPHREVSRPAPAGLAAKARPSPVARAPSFDDYEETPRSALPESSRTSEPEYDSEDEEESMFDDSLVQETVIHKDAVKPLPSRPAENFRPPAVITSGAASPARSSSPIRAAAPGRVYEETGEIAQPMSASPKSQHGSPHAKAEKPPMYEVPSALEYEAEEGRRPRPAAAVGSPIASPSPKHRDFKASLPAPESGPEPGAEPESGYWYGPVPVPVPPGTPGEVVTLDIVTTIEDDNGKATQLRKQVHFHRAELLRSLGTPPAVPTQENLDNWLSGVRAILPPEFPPSVEIPDSSRISMTGAPSPKATATATVAPTSSPSAPVPASALPQGVGSRPFSRQTFEFGPLLQAAGKDLSTRRPLPPVLQVTHWPSVHRRAVSPGGLRGPGSAAAG
eukprot:RCo051454